MSNLFNHQETTPKQVLEHAKKIANLVKEQEKGKKFKWVDHPTQIRAKLRIEIKD